MSRPRSFGRAGARASRSTSESGYADGGRLPLELERTSSPPRSAEGRTSTRLGSIPRPVIAGRSETDERGKEATQAPEREVVSKGLVRPLGGTLLPFSEPSHVFVRPSAEPRRAPVMVVTLPRTSTRHNLSFGVTRRLVAPRRVPETGPRFGTWRARQPLPLRDSRHRVIGKWSSARRAGVLTLRRAGVGRDHQPMLPGTPLKGPTRSEVIQPP